ncbi:MAG: hypothetical protein IT371_23145 [Deltaproteobacteria bacterium]|nr:hypothetical protein [Deltaproteobacteria bacterium]
MPCFTRPVAAVGQTQLYARAADDGGQLLAISATVAAREDLALLVPLPTPAGTAADAVRFLDLQSYPTFFDELGLGFTALPRAASAAPPRALRGTPRAHAIAPLELSVAPDLASLARLDARFAPSPRLLARLAEYADFAFAVLRLTSWGGLLAHFRRPQARLVLPVALHFPRRWSDRLYFPTLAVHDGDDASEPELDHLCYCQPDERTEPHLARWERSAHAASSFVDPGRAQGLVDGRAPCHRLTLRGPRGNQDLVVGPPLLR